MVTIMSGYQSPAFSGTFILPSGTWNRSLSKLIVRVVCTSHWPKSAAVEYSPLTRYYRSCLLLFRLNKGILLERFVAKSASGGSCCYLVTKPCLTLCDPMDCSPPGSSVHRVFQTRILEWVAISFSRGSSWSRDQTHISCIGSWTLYHWATRGDSLVGRTTPKFGKLKQEST